MITQNRFLVRCVLLMVGIITSSSTSLATTQTDDAMTRIDLVATDPEHASQSDCKAAVDSIEEQPDQVAEKLLAKLQDTNLSEHQLATYVWALGLTKSQTAMAVLTKLHEQGESQIVKSNCLNALAQIGGKDAEDYLLKVLDATTDPMERFDILNLLAQLQCEAALPKMDEVLYKDPQEFYWQAVFVFCKMGDKAVPYLLQKIDDENINVRTHAINILGEWLMAPEALEPLKEKYWKETDAEIRKYILSSLIYVTTDLNQLRAVYGEIADRDKDAEVVTFANKWVENANQLEAEMDAYIQTKHVSQATFQKEYSVLFKSAGKEGLIGSLMSVSTNEDEPKLKALRERILQRNSDEAFYDYKEINQIILQNRWLSNRKP